MPRRKVGQFINITLVVEKEHFKGFLVATWVVANFAMILMRHQNTSRALKPIFRF
jgi:hypothetical protein